MIILDRNIYDKENNTDDHMTGPGSWLKSGFPNYLTCDMRQGYYILLVLFSVYRSYVRSKILVVLAFIHFLALLEWFRHVMVDKLEEII